MNKKIILNEEYFLSKGGERNCYIHPNDNSKVIKIVHRQEKHNEQNKLEYMYYNYLQKNNISLKYLSKCFGFVDTNFGEGLVFERILDFDKTPSKSFKVYLENKLFDKSLENSLVTDLKIYLFENDILFIDVDLSNVFCKKISNDKYRLIIIDGLGARRLNWRFYLYLFSKKFTRYKIKKQWTKFYSNYLKYSKYY
ncbi:MAG: YrbL family protein [Arcobacter sp.]|uniref:YrbL family protein n=1 Tax=Arcobacter sp. TaxID=1872629 RepID=UPI003C71E798